MKNDKFKLGSEYDGFKISVIHMCSEYALVAKKEGLEIVYYYDYLGEYSIHWAICFKNKSEVSRWNLKLCQGFEWDK